MRGEYRAKMMDTERKAQDERIHANGEGVVQDYKEVFKWTRLAAEQGHSKAQYNLGLLYYNGRGVRKDYKEAVKWYRKSAERGHDLAQYYLGEMYYRGQGVRKNKSMAHMYWNIAAVSGYKIAIKERDRIEGVMSDSQIEKAQDLAREWMRKHQ